MLQRLCLNVLTASSRLLPVQDGLCRPHVNSHRKINETLIKTITMLTCLRFLNMSKFGGCCTKLEHPPVGQHEVLHLYLPICPLHTLSLQLPPDKSWRGTWGQNPLLQAVPRCFVCFCFATMCPSGRGYSVAGLPVKLGFLVNNKSLFLTSVCPMIS